MASDESKLEKLDLTEDELRRLKEAFKKEEFRKLFQEYAEEISDPANKARYEEEIRQMENQRGNDIQFVHPKPGFVLQTDIPATGMKAFINISSSDLMDKPSSEARTEGENRRGLMWSIPHSFSPPREDYCETNKTKCMVFDVVFHPDTLHMAKSNPRFKKMLEDTALDGIANQFSTNLNKSDVQYPNIEFKGTPQAVVIRKSKDDKNVLQTPLEKTDPKSYIFGEDHSKKESSSSQKTEGKVEKCKPDGEDKKGGPITPKYSIVHQSDWNIQNMRDNVTDIRPHRLLAIVDLPLLDSAKSVNLDVFERNFKLNSDEPIVYELDAPLPYPVDTNAGSAKFDKSKRQLHITLQVIPNPVKDESIKDLPGTESSVQELCDTVADTNIHTDGELR